MTPTEAADLWPQLESTGLALGSPAPADPSDGWLQSFMAIAHARHLRVDFIALHFYPDFTHSGSVQALAKELARVHQRYHLPIWVTEIGSVNIRSWGEHMDLAPTESRAVTFMKRIVHLFAAMPKIVARFAWFLDGDQGVSAWRTTTMYNADGQLTPLGQAFTSEK